MSNPDVLELLSKLESEHIDGEHLYRGQRRRHAPHRWTLHGVQHEVEGVYPADFRFNYTIQDFSPEHQTANELRVTQARAYGRKIRDRFIQFLLVGHERDPDRIWPIAWKEQADEMRTAIQAGTAPQDSHFYRMAWSLAQHYTLATALTDLTFSTRVAAWFATQPWESTGPPPQPGSRGVIYRVNRSRLEAILDLKTQVARVVAERKGLPLAPDLFLVDIRELPPEFARRPSAQQGASLYGFDQADIIDAAFKVGAIETFEFEHRAEANIGVEREDIKPSEDSFLQVLEKFEAAREILAPQLHNSQPSDRNVGALERANTALNLGVRQARQVATVRLDERSVATVFDQIQRIGTIAFRYLMVVEDEPTKALLGITAEPMKFPSELPSDALQLLGFGDEALRVWMHGQTDVVEYGHWESMDQFVASAAAAASRATIKRA